MHMPFPFEVLYRMSFISTPMTSRDLILTDFGCLLHHHPGAHIEKQMCTSVKIKYCIKQNDNGDIHSCMNGTIDNITEICENFQTCEC